MKQRVGIAQALLNDPQLLIVDEFMFVLTRYKTRGSTAAWISPIAVV